MELYFLRHGIAAEPGTVAVSHDSERPLTSEGVEKMEREVESMRCMGLLFDSVVSSPYLRAKETANLVAKGLKFKDKVRYSEALVPGAEFKSFFKLLKEFKPESRVLFVGHMPSLGEFVSHLVSGQGAVEVDFKKGGLCRVDMPQNPVPGALGRLEWFLTPKQIRCFGS